MQGWPRIKHPDAPGGPKNEPGPKPGAKQGAKPRPPEPTQAPVEGYWQEWTPQDPVPNNGYDAELWLPPGAYIVNAAAGIHLAPEATGPSDVECSLFVGEDNRSLNQLTVAPGDGQSIAATCHVDSPDAPTVVQWVCGGTTGPFRLTTAVTAIRVSQVHHVASTWWPS